MRQKIALLVLTLFFFIFKAQQVEKIQEGEVEYYVVFGSKSNKLKEKISDNIGVSKEKISSIVDELFSNNTAKQTIKFKDNKTLFIPEIKPETRTRKKFNIAQILLEKGGIYYADLSKNIVYNERTTNDKDIIVKYNISDIKWNITDETTVINGYKVIKATAKYKFEKDKGKQVMRDVVAWFSEDIPIKVSPMNFYGLPGMVVMLEIKGRTFIINSVKEKKVALNYKLNSKKIISEDEYMDLLNEID